MTNAIAPLKHTPLFDLHQQAQARLAGFGGWKMPIQYSGITAEHQAVRQQAGMFDISHMGKFALKGQNLAAQLQSLVPSDLSRLSAGAAKYTLFLNQQAGILDDLIFYCQGQDQGILIVNAATTDKDRDWLLKHLDPSQLELTDISQAQTLIALQGLKAAEILQPLVEDDLTSLRPYHHAPVTLLGQTAWIARTGYTGEDGFEIMSNPALGLELWQTLQDRGVMPCGLGARDTLRLEAAMGLYGQDIDETTTPLEAGLGWVLTAKTDFVGAAALVQQKQQGIKRKLVGLEMQGRHIARHDYPILDGGHPIGIVTSGTLSPTLGKAIALGYVPPHLAEIGQELAITIRGQAYPAKVVQRPFYHRPKSS